ncbi:uncharacterized protein RAG0_10428 [Rhynchosporium agropyri]|uniref:Uncharacterized protein n=1 Tax=Rhynchosporium agropyri TaxID=914238 RepID=A0A1E1KZW9_9HELO|nr:uncharacterized protein RAG0_10428 [Rhynchosporium agropyri]
MSGLNGSMPSRMSQSPPSTPYTVSSATENPRTPQDQDQSSSALTPITPFVTPIGHTIPLKPALLVGVSNKHNSSLNLSTSTPAKVASRTEDYDDIFKSVLKLPEDKWESASLKFLLKEDLVSRKNAKILREKFVKAVEAVKETRSACGWMWRSGPSVDPESYAFRIFNTFTLAMILKDQPEMAAKFKLEAENSGVKKWEIKKADSGKDKNVIVEGTKTEIKTPVVENYHDGVCQWIDMVAEDPEAVLKGVLSQCAMDAESSPEDKLNLWDTLIAMACLFEFDYEKLCRMYPEYETVPRVIVDEKVATSTHGRPIRARRARELGQ